MPVVLIKQKETYRILVDKRLRPIPDRQEGRKLQKVNGEGKIYYETNVQYFCNAE